MSYVVATSTDTFTRGQDRPGGVPVSAWLTSAGLAPEGSHTQPTTRRVAPSAPRTGDRGVDGRHQHHRSARPHATLDQSPFRCTDRSILALTSHRERGQNFRFEVLHGNHVMVVNYRRSPSTPCVRVLVRGPSMQRRSCASGAPVTARRGTTGAAPRHLPLSLGQLASTPLPITHVGKVEPAVGGPGCAVHTLADADAARDSGHRIDLSARHEPMPKAVPVDPDTGGHRWQLFGPHDGNAHTCGQAQPPARDREPSGGVPPRRAGPFAALEFGSPATLDLERVAQRPGGGPQHLLLGDLRTFTQSRELSTRASEQVGQGTQCAAPTSLLLVDCLVPQEPAPPPLREQPALALNTRAQAVHIARGLHHHRNPSAGTDTTLPKANSRPTHQRPYLPTAKAGGFSGAFR
jgi:hypothetical protein